MLSLDGSAVPNGFRRTVLKRFMGPSPRHFRPRYAPRQAGAGEARGTRPVIEVWLVVSPSRRPGGGAEIPARPCDSCCDPRLAALRAKESGLSRPRGFAHI